MRLAACAEMVFTDLPFVERVQRLLAASVLAASVLVASA